MKKLAVGLCLSMFCLLAQGCVDFNVGKRPTDQNNTKWVSQNPDIYFEVNDEYGAVTGCNTYGKTTVNGATTEIAVRFDYGTTVQFSPISAYHKGENGSQSYIDGDDWLFIGRCEFSKNMLVVNVFNNSKGFLDDEIKKITFVKEEK